MQRRLRGKGPAVRVHVGLQPVADGEQQPDSNPVDPVEEILQPAADGEQQTDSVPAEPIEETLYNLWQTVSNRQIPSQCSQSKTR